MPEASPVAAWLQRVWYDGQGGAWLRPLGLVYRGIVALRRVAYRLGLLRSGRVSVPVIVVGNLSVGGTGKTPLTAWIVQRLVALGHRPGIATRGHGRQRQGVLRVDGQHSAADVGDEPLLLARRTGVPVCVASRRLKAAQALQAAGCDVVVCDDGLQHLSLARDLEIAVIDGTRGLGNGRLLPAGPLREPPSRLAQVDLVVVNGGGDFATRAFPQALHMSLAGDEVRPLLPGVARRLSDFAGRRVHALAGIGNPGRFFAQLRGAGLDPIEHPLPDHHVFTAADLAFDDELPVLMTEKDAVKCQAFADHRHCYVPVEASFGAQDAARLSACLESLCRQGERIR